MLQPRTWQRRLYSFTNFSQISFLTYLSLLHRRLCHHHLAGIRKLLSGNLVTGLKLDSKAEPDPVCEACKAGKMHADPFPSSSTRATRPLQLVHSDVHGPVKVSTHQGYRYWVSFIDDFSRFKAVYLLKRKSETFAAFKQFKAWAENVTGLRMGSLRDDKGGEYMSREFEAFCIDHGIQRQHTVQNRPQQNGLVKTGSTSWLMGMTVNSTTSSACINMYSSLYCLYFGGMRICTIQEMSLMKNNWRSSCILHARGRLIGHCKSDFREVETLSQCKIRSDHVDSMI